ncbi:hypothetical protein BU16DRAFT_4237 [Lophium mytilinum]|uniref:Uncharacterized protein n=1 Tax=Lophium mytilinum TaxID=390894 RepID=A0A6A6RCM4_9PEZI|nr:hypothetical protein BU16DRAFT_4237 [Lophium mytilinum]
MGLDDPEILYGSSAAIPEKVLQLFEAYGEGFGMEVADVVCVSLPPCGSVCCGDWRLVGACTGCGRMNDTLFSYLRGYLKYAKRW